MISCPNCGAKSTVKTINKKLLIFDVDGTIWNSEPDIFLSFNHVLKSNADMEVTMEEFKRLAGLSLTSMFENVLPENKRSMARELGEKYKKHYIDEGHFADATILYPGVTETLEFFKKENYFLTVASSKPKRILDKMIKHFNLIEFDLVLGTEESDFRHKPDPDLIHHTLGSLKVKNEDAVIIGDTKADILAGINAKIDTIAVTYGFDRPENLISLNPTFVIDDFSKLKEIVRRSQG